MFRKRLISCLLVIVSFIPFIGFQQKCFGSCPTSLCYQSCCNSNGPGRHSCSMGASNEIGACTCSDGSTVPCRCGSSGPNCNPLATPTGTPSCDYVCMPAMGNYQTTRCSPDKDLHDMYVGGYCCCDRSPTPSPTQTPTSSPTSSPAQQSSATPTASPCTGCGPFNDPPGSTSCGESPGSIVECSSNSCSFYPVGNCPSGQICVGFPSGTCPPGLSCFSGSVHCEVAPSPVFGGFQIQQSESSNNTDINSEDFSSTNTYELPSSTDTFDTMYP